MIELSSTMVGWAASRLQVSRVLLFELVVY